MPTVNEGKRVHVDVGSLKLIVDADSPGIVRLVGPRGLSEIHLPRNKEEGEQFIQAYRIALECDVQYRTLEWKP